MQDDLQKAYSAYQQALYLLPNPKVSRPFILPTPLGSHVKSKEDPKLWYGIGILYDRYGSLDHAEEAFASVLKMDKGWLPFFFEKRSAIYLFRRTRF
jgi:glucose repression mediator protein